MGSQPTSFRVRYLRSQMISIPESEAPGAVERCPITGATGPRPQQIQAPQMWPRPDRVADEAHEYLFLLEREGLIDAATRERRLGEIRQSVQRSGTYRHTPVELEHGARVAWRNSSRCIGRLYWQKLAVRDFRHLDHPDDIFSTMVDHMKSATNEGKVQSMISVFAPQEPGSPGIQIWNPQMIRYAGYRRADGTVLGDPAHVEFTELVRKLGWKGGPGTPFDVLPIVIQMPGQKPRLYELPEEAIFEVDLTHPEYDWFEEIGLKWHVLPVIANMRLEVGGISYTAAPFNGWYMGTEIGARNLADTDRYDMLPAIARCMDLDTRSSRRLWRDRALVELNVAVLHSFQKVGATIIDHHTAAKHFIRHEEFETQADRPLPADWSWIVPPISGSATEVFHREYHDTSLRPNYFYQPKAWEGFFPAEEHERRDVDLEQTDKDGLTGLLHRGALDRRIHRFAQSGGVLALLDIDDFSEINEQNGQPIGNALLRAAAQTLVGTVRPDDTCARFGGDSFCLLLAGVETGSDAIAVADRIRNALDRVQLDEAPKVGLKASVAMTFVEPGSDGYAALNLVQHAVRMVKEGGGDRAVVVEASRRKQSAAAAAPAEVSSNGNREAEPLREKPEDRPAPTPSVSWRNPVGRLFRS